MLLSEKINLSKRSKNWETTKENPNTNNVWLIFEEIMVEFEVKLFVDNAAGFDSWDTLTKVVDRCRKLYKIEATKKLKCAKFFWKIVWL